MPHDEPPRTPGLGLPALVGLALAAGAFAAGLPGRAQEEAAAVPDLAGIYTGRRCVTGEGEVCPELSRAGAETMLTARARAFTEAFDELAAPKYDCAPATLPGLFGDPLRTVINITLPTTFRTVPLAGGSCARRVAR